MINIIWIREISNGASNMDISYSISNEPTIAYILDIDSMSLEYLYFIKIDLETLFDILFLLYDYKMDVAKCIFRSYDLDNLNSQ